MGALKEADSSKWINTLIVIGACLVGYIFNAFLVQMAEWFDLEAKVPNFVVTAQIVSILVGFGSFIFVLKHKESYQYLQEVYGELTKVIWPDKDSTVKLTISIVIGVAISGAFLSLSDMGIRELLNLLY